MIRRSWFVLASAALLLAGCQDANKNKPTAAKQEEQPAYSPPPSRSLDSMDRSTPPPRDSTYSSNPPADTYNYNEANNPPETMTPTKSSKSKSGAAKSSSAGGKTYTVKQGDTLAKIAKKYYGDESKWKKIADANKSKVPDPKKLKVGTKLVIP